MSESKKPKETEVAQESPFWKPAHVETNVYNIYIGKQVKKNNVSGNDQSSDKLKSKL